MPRKITFEEAKRQFEERFPDKQLLSYKGNAYPCDIQCPIHGAVQASSFTSAKFSRHGCPVCGRAAQNRVSAIYGEVVKRVKEEMDSKNPIDTEALVKEISENPEIDAREIARKPRKLSRKVINSNLQLNTATFQPKSNPENFDPEEFVFVPFHKDIALAAGSGKLNNYSQLTFKLPFGRATLRRHGIQFDKAVCCQVEGDSMEPKLPDGATVGIDTASTAIKDGKTYAIVQDGLARIKILSKEPGDKVRIRSLNPAYPDEIVSADAIQIVGRMFWYSALE